MAIFKPGCVPADEVMGVLVGPGAPLIDEEGAVGDVGFGGEGDGLEEVEGGELVAVLVEALFDLGGDEGADYGHVVADHVFRVEVGEEGEGGHGGFEEGAGGEGHGGGGVVVVVVLVKGEV